MLIYSAIVSLDGYTTDDEGKFDWAEPNGLFRSGNSCHVAFRVGLVGARVAVEQDQHVPERVFDEDDLPDGDVIGPATILPPLATNTPAASSAERTFQFGS